jgi:hypothetical protein
MDESWFRREFLVPRRLAFNVLFYGIQLGLFAYGWYSQVSFIHQLFTGKLPHATLMHYRRKLTRNWLPSTVLSSLCGVPVERGLY